MVFNGTKKPSKAVNSLICYSFFTKVHFLLCDTTSLTLEKFEWNLTWCYLKYPFSKKYVRYCYILTSQDFYSWKTDCYLALFFSKVSPNRRLSKIGKPIKVCIKQKITKTKSKEFRLPNKWCFAFPIYFENSVWMKKLKYTYAVLEKTMTFS